MKRSLIALLICVSLLLALAGCTTTAQVPTETPAATEDDPSGYKALFKQRYEAAWTLAQHYVGNGGAGEQSVAVTDENGSVWRPCGHYSSIEALKAATLEIFTEDASAGFFQIAFEGDNPAYKEEDGTLWQNSACLFDMSPWLGETLVWEGNEIECLQWDTLTLRKAKEDTLTFTIDTHFWYPGDPINVSFILLKGQDDVWRFDTYFEESASERAEALALQYLRENGEEVEITHMWLAARYNDVAEYAVEAYALEWQVEVMNQGQLRWLPASFGDGVSYLIFSRMGEDYSILAAKSVPDGGDVKKAAVEAVYGLSNLEFSICGDGGHGWYGLGGSKIQVLSDGFSEERLEHDVYYEGDYWFRRTYPGLNLRCYFSAESNRPSIYSISLTRDDLTTYRGIKVGDSRADVLRAYPEISAEHFPIEEWGDQLVYESIPGAICGYFLHFYFENDSVSHIMIENMFD